MSSQVIQVIHRYTRPSGEAVVFTLLPGRQILVHIDHEIVETWDIPRTEGEINGAALRFARNWQDDDSPNNA